MREHAVKFARVAADDAKPCRVGGCPRAALCELRIEGQGETLAVRLCPKHVRMVRDAVDERVW